jgi:hypothetical protein
MNKHGKPGRPREHQEGPRERFQAMVAPNTIKWLKRHEWPGRKLDELVQREIQKEDFNNES